MKTQIVTRKKYEEVMASLVVTANDPALVERLAVKMYVRGGLDWTLESEGDLKAAVRHLLTGKAPAVSSVLTPPNRALLAASLLTGWVTHRPVTNPQVLTWHRLLGRTAVEITRSKEQ